MTVDLITNSATERLMGSVEMLDEVMIHVSNRFHHAPDNGTRLKTYELFSLGIFHLVFYI